MLHFAYGSNMHRGVMRRHAAQAVPLGAARLGDHRFIVTVDGYASTLPAPGRTVHGMLWRLRPRDRATLDHWENIAGGEYRAAFLPVRFDGGGCRALVYIARPRPLGDAKPGYMEAVVAAARELKLPADYIAELERWLPRRRRAAGHRNFGSFGPTEAA